MHTMTIWFDLMSKLKMALAAAVENHVTLKRSGQTGVWTQDLLDIYQVLYPLSYQAAIVSSMRLYLASMGFSLRNFQQQLYCCRRDRHVLGLVHS